MKYTKEEAIKKAKEFISEVNKLEKKYNMSFSSDTGDVYFNYKSKKEDKYWDTIPVKAKGDVRFRSVLSKIISGILPIFNFKAVFSSGVILRSTTASSIKSSICETSVSNNFFREGFYDSCLSNRRH